MEQKKNQQYVYVAWHFRKTDYREYPTLKETSLATGVSYQRIARSIKENHAVDGWKFDRRELNPDRQAKSKYLKPRASMTNGVIAIRDGEMRWYPDVAAASKGTKVPKVMVQKCISDGMDSENRWTFDFALDEPQKEAEA